MGAPLTVNSPTTGQVVILLDGDGDIIGTGVLTMAQGIVLATSSAPAAAPGSVAIYNPDGVSIAFRGSDGQPISQTVTGNLTVTGNESVGGTLAVTGTTTLGDRETITSASTAGALSITQSVATTTNPGTIAVNESAAANGSIGLYVSGDTTPRYTVSAAGIIRWSAGSGSQDVTVQRSSAGVLGVTGIISAGSGTDTAGSAPALTPAFSSGLAAQLTDTTRDYMVYLQIGTAGTITLAIGPTSTPANTIINAGVATGGELISYRLPAGWFTEVTLTTATLANQKAIGC